MSGTSHLRREFDALRRSGRLPQRGKKVARDRVELAQAKPLLLERSGGRCEAGQSPYCRGVGSEIHHLKKRSQGGSNDPRNLAWVCGPCNGWVEDNPDAAHRAGLVTKSWEQEA
jgi:5-methylcytosine-specific restriction endonuclease McrA